MKNILSDGLKYYYKIKNHASQTEELQQTTLNLKKVLDKESQFLHTCLYLF